MRRTLLRTMTAICCFFILSEKASAQNFSFNCARDTIVPGCPANLCITLKGIIPDLRGLTSSYNINPTSTVAGCTPVYVEPNDPTGTSTGLVVDDTYSSVINIGFPFPFFGTIYNSLIASTNGLVSFDISKAGGFAHFSVPGDLVPGNSYDRAIIMGPYHDLDPSIGSSPTQRIQYQGFGIAPHRRWIFSFYKVPLYSSSGVCDPLIENTHQIVLYESTGIIEVTIFSKQICTFWQSGKAMVGMQDFSKTQFIMAPNRRVSDPAWGSVGMNESWRFVPAGGASLFKRVELTDIAGTLITTGTVVNLGNGRLEASFPNICAPVGATTPYIIRSVYEKIDDPTIEIFGSDTVRVNRAAGLTGTGTSSPASCGGSDGTITINGVTGGTAPYEYSLDGITWQSSNVFIGLAPNLYTVQVRDASTLCTRNIPVTVTVSGTLAATTTSSGTACTGVNNGSITITSAAGTGPYTFSIDGSAPLPGTIPYTFSNLLPGTHTIVVTDLSVGCSSGPLTVNVATGPGVTANASPATTSCPTAADGSITVNATAGTAPFTYQLDGGAIFSGANPYTFTGVAAGAHTIVVTDIIGCTRTINVTVAAGPILSANAIQAATSCSGATDGSITVTPTSGTGPYSFSLDGGPFIPGAAPYTFTSLAAGVHTVVITDISTGCVSNNIPVTVVAGPVLAATAIETATSCSGATNGTITVTPTNGNAPYTFSLDGGAAITGAAPFTFTNVAAGPHTVVMTDGAGCITNTINITVTAGPALTTAINKTDVLCNGGATGIITVTTPTIGTAPYEYSLDGVTWQAGNIFSGLAAGTYTVYYREANGCQGSQSIVVGEPAVLTATVAMIAVVCNGQSDGIITVTSGGGILPYEYSIDGGTNWQTSNVFNRAAGNYTIIIRDVNNCTTTQNIIVTEPAALTAFSANGAASCDGGNDGVITVTANGGNTGYQYSLDGITFQASNVFSVAPGNYTVTVKDNLGCTTTFNTKVLLGSNFTLTPQTDPTICEGRSTQLQLNSNATVYSWTPAIGLSSTTIANPVANPIVTTQYIVTATLGRCSGEDTVIVNVNAAPVPNAGPDGFICFGQTYQLNASGGTQYSWSPATYLDNSAIANPISTPVKDINYSLSILSDVNGCSSIITDQMRIDVTPPIKVKTFPYDTVGYNGDQFRLLAVPSDTDVINYSWSPITGLSDPTIANPIVTAGVIGDVVQYRVVTSTIAGCKGEGYVTVRVYKGPDIYVPSGFTPNNDGKNDKFTPFPVGMKSYKYFRVFNRWGQIIFSTTKLHDGWDGKLGGRDQATGTYVWMIEGVTKDDRVITKKGTVTLIR